MKFGILACSPLLLTSSLWTIFVVQGDNCSCTAPPHLPPSRDDASVAHVGKLCEKINVILMISDGFGPTSETFARNLYQHEHKLNPTQSIFPLDTMQVGTCRTRPAELNQKVKDPKAFTQGNPITDSAAGATAFSCGIKTYNEGVAVDVSRSPCGTLFEAAKLKGIKTGTVCTSRVTHATPAAFSAHAIDRNMESFIAHYLVGNFGAISPVNDLLLGGGLCEFLPKLPGLPSCRSDNEDLLLSAKKRGYNIITNRSQLYSADNSTMPLIGLFSLDHMAYDIDRAAFNEPSLAEMTEKALDLLTDYTSESPLGFLLMVEGSRIDMAAHKNDPQSHYRDIVAYQRAVQVAKKYTRCHEKTLLISVSDHETGGLAIGRQLDPKIYPDYVWYPEPIINATRSLEFLSNATYYTPREDSGLLETVIREDILNSGLSIKDPSDDIVKDLMAFSRNRTIVEKLLSSLVSRSAQVGWSTHGHSGVDVNLYAYGYKSEALVGNHDNTFVGSFIEELLGLNLDAVTEKVKNDPVTDAPWTNTYSDHKAPFRIRHYHIQGSIFD